MTLYHWKPQFQNLLRPAVRGLSLRGVTANGVTVAAAMGSIVVGLCMALLAETRAVFLLLPAWGLVVDAGFPDAHRSQRGTRPTRAEAMP